MASLSEQAALDDLARRLTSAYSDIPQDRVSAAIHVAHARFEQSPIRDFIPLLVERRVRDDLTELSWLLESAR